MKEGIAYTVVTTAVRPTAEWVQHTSVPQVHIRGAAVSPISSGATSGISSQTTGASSITRIASLKTRKVVATATIAPPRPVASPQIDFAVVHVTSISSAASLGVACHATGASSITRIASLKTRKVVVAVASITPGIVATAVASPEIDITRTRVSAITPISSCGVACQASCASSIASVATVSEHIATATIARPRPVASSQVDIAVVHVAPVSPVASLGVAGCAESTSAIARIAPLKVCVLSVGS